MSFRQWLGRLIAGAEEHPPTATDSLEEEAAGLNFRSAIEVHRGWSARLQAVIDDQSSENLAVPVVSSDQQCALGRWIYSQGNQHFGQDPLFQTLVKSHTHFHQCAGQVLELAQEGKKAEAQQQIHSGDYVRASQEVIMDLAHMYQKASEKG